MLSIFTENNSWTKKILMCSITFLLHRLFLYNVLALLTWMTVQTHLRHHSYHHLNCLTHCRHGNDVISMSHMIYWTPQRRCSPEGHFLQCRQEDPDYFSESLLVGRLFSQILMSEAFHSVERKIHCLPAHHSSQTRSYNIWKRSFKKWNFHFF